MASVRVSAKRSVPNHSPRFARHSAGFMAGRLAGFPTGYVARCLRARAVDFSTSVSSVVCVSLGMSAIATLMT